MEHLFHFLIPGEPENMALQSLIPFFNTFTTYAISLMHTIRTRVGL